MPRGIPIALTIAGSDPSGGAGIQADLRTFHQFGVYGEAAVAVITVQNTVSARRVHSLPADLVAEQIRAAVEDIRPNAIKTGALGTAANVRAVAALVREFGIPAVVDPVTIGKHGAELLDAGALAALRDALIPAAALVTPNLSEASALACMDVRDPDEMRRAAERIAAMGACAVLVKGGHLPGAALDILRWRGEWFEFVTERIDTRHTHGAGCSYSAAITAGLAGGLEIPEAVRQAKLWVTEAIRTAPGFGAGCGPLNHFAAVQRSSPPRR